MIRTRQKDISNFVRRNESRKQVKLSIFSTHCSCLIYLWLLGALHMIPSVIYSFPHNSRCVVCILDYPTLPLIMRETYLIIPFALDRRRMKERKHLQQWFQFLIIAYYYSNRDENISTDVFDPSWDSLFYFESSIMTFYV